MSLKSASIWLLIGTALAAVFAAYLQPDLLFAMANQLWACF